MNSDQERHARLMREKSTSLKKQGVAWEGWNRRRKRESRTAAWDEKRTTSLIAACDRLLAVESELAEMPVEQRRWFMGKPGHADCFMVARALKGLLE